MSAKHHFGSTQSLPGSQYFPSSGTLKRGRIIDRRDIYLNSTLGHGQFGDVFKASYDSEIGCIPVAVKTCRDERENPEIAVKFLEEANRMLSLKHDHIINIIGVCPEHPIWIIMELAEHGELTKYLRYNKQILTYKTLLSFTHQISTALSYLESKKFVHRDVAARNILVCRQDRVKLADFGLSRFVGDEQVYSKSTVGKLPIKWMSPESINYRIFSSASDVWMFGVCMWEIMSLGEKPFADVKNDDVIDKVEKGERLPRPFLCCGKLYGLMLKCWRYEPKERPTFQTIEIYLSVMLSRTKDDDDDEKSPLEKQTCIYNDVVDSISDLPPPKPPRYSTYRGSVSRDRDYGLSRNENTSPERSIITSTYIPIYADVYSAEEKPIVLEEIIEKQKKESEEDAEWLKQMESNFFS